MTKDKLNETHDTMMWDMVERSMDKVSGKTAFAAMKQGDKAGAEVVDEYIGYLACGITNMINIFQPEVLCIGGGICREGDYLIKPIMELVINDQYTRNTPKKTEVKVAVLATGRFSGLPRSANNKQDKRKQTGAGSIASVCRFIFCMIIFARSIDCGSRLRPPSPTCRADHEAYLLPAGPDRPPGQGLRDNPAASTVSDARGHLRRGSDRARRRSFHISLGFVMP